MSLLSQFMDAEELVKLNDRQVSELTDHVDGFLVKQLVTNETLQRAVKENMKPIVNALMKKG